eukprot:CAMPEP_0180667448 /NCGR_PEP_ID=MMETSP1037_2-20121125/62383_1 /TAXON_ID=632150 /ORGANISM="Azadinium spinosum, Strain 3D9" /LENGTH=94 /DNA_ID=CAMNT_0022696083 /DNA_START=117 /DNA_END=398 /DNA_ORIENTATION=-
MSGARPSPRSATSPSRSARSPSPFAAPAPAPAPSRSPSPSPLFPHGALNLLPLSTSRMHLPQAPGTEQIRQHHEWRSCGHSHAQVAGAPTAPTP